ncbi:MAG: signal peptidase I [Solirubrobacteraceae bacterium]
MKPRRFRSGLITATIIALVAAAWLFLAPTRIGGSTTYVITSGVSMEPRFHTGDLAIVRPATHYRVGMVVAYHSSLLKVVVLHRVVAIHDGRYTFKGDNNNFLDPVHPTRSHIIGALWVQVPHGGRVLKALHSQVTVILLCVFVGLLLVGGTDKRRRGRRHGNRPARPSRPPEIMKTLRDNTSAAPSLRSLLMGVGAAAAGFAILAGFAVEHPSTKTVTEKVSYTQRTNFSYRADAPRGAVYPNGVVSTGDPIFLALVHRIGLKATYHFDALGAKRVTGSQQLVLKLSGPSGWSRSIPLTPVRHFTGVTSTAATVLDLGAVQSLLQQVQKQTGLPAAYGFTLAIALSGHVHGSLAGQPVDQGYNSAMPFTLQPLELQPGIASTPGGSQNATGPNQKKNGSVTASSTVPNPLHVLGRTMSYSTLAWVGLLGFVICALSMVPLAVLLRRNSAFDEAARIRARYGHMLVPILIGEDLGWPPVDVTTFKALVRLAEAAGQVILHHQDDAVDTYLVNDNGTVYRYQIKLPVVSWGEWTETNLAADPAALAEAATALADVAAAPSNGAAPTPG